MHGQRLRVARPGRRLDVLTPHRLGIAAGQGHDRAPARRRSAASRASAASPLPDA